jgi:hypothetical protein
VSNLGNALANDPFRRKRLVAAAGLCAVAAMVVISLWPTQKLTNAKQGNAMTELSKNMKTVCIGRYLIDIPKDADFSLGDSESDSVKIERIPAFTSESAYRERLRDHEQMLRSSPHKKEGIRLRSVTQVNGGKQTIFVSRRTADESFVSLVETFVAADSTAWKVFIDVADEDVAPVSAEATSTASSLASRQSSDIPKAAGACIRDGLLSRTPTQRETFNGGARLEGRSWSLSVTSETSTARETGKQLFDRVDRAIDMAGSNSGIKKLRRAKVDADGRVGQEYIAIYPDSHANILDAKLELYGSGKPQVPTIKLQMEVGSPRKADPTDPRVFMKDEDALALWDAIVKSIRPRPGAF